jgi:hypothetical protein
MASPLEKAVAPLSRSIILRPWGVFMGSFLQRHALVICGQRLCPGFPPREERNVAHSATFSEQA